ncbi:MAG: restriction endonuclease subunit S [Magnetococcales bacterium]|nr:restriction endonuclease subunit S [Magnetococcales bacterium]
MSGKKKRPLVPRLRFPEFREAGEWENEKLGDVCNVLQGYGFPEVLQGKIKGKYPFCKVSDISRAVAEQGGILCKASNYIDDEELIQLRAKPLPTGSTVFAKIGEALRLNRRALTATECLIDNNAAGISAKNSFADNYFIFLLSQLIDLNAHCGGAVPSVNKSTLESIRVVIPSHREQQKIADCLSSLDDLIAAQEQKLEILKRHKKSLMQQLFPAQDEESA